MKKRIKWIIYIIIGYLTILFLIYLWYVSSFISFNTTDIIDSNKITIKATVKKYKYYEDINSTFIIGAIKVYGAKNTQFKSIDLECFQASLDNSLSSGIHYSKAPFDIIYNRVPTINNILEREVYWSFDTQIPINKKSIFKIKIEDTCYYDDKELYFRSKERMGY